MAYGELGKSPVPEMGWTPPVKEEAPSGGSGGEQKPPQRNRKSKKKNKLSWILLLVIIILCMALVITVIHYENQQIMDAAGKPSSDTSLDGEDGDISGDPNDPVDEVGVDVPQEDLPEEGWIAVSDLKKSAQEYYVTTEFLQSLFPENIVYKHGGVIYYATLDPTLPRNTYDRNDFYTKNGRTHYTFPDGSEAAVGIDVSSHQGEINWAKVAADGIDFAVIRAGFRGYGSGEINPDKQFEANLKGASENGIKVGVYFFSQAINEEEAVEEANYVLEVLDGFDLDLPVIFDTEEVAGTNARANNLSKEQTTNCTIAFCETIKEAGYQPMVYASSKWYAMQLDLPKLAEYDKWLAQYYERPGYPYEYQMWQYSNKGSVAGIKGDVDLNLCFKNYWE
ncbi:MAG: glycoside hydrolase family 25 protein [Firmicutes bacterium]|nr:glycoside hydrolase family 25 protein [Bacillota bacterium]